LPTNFHSLTIQRRSDCIRLALIKNYGGIYLDIGIWVNHDFVQDIFESQKAFVGYSLLKYSRNQDLSIVESWAMASPPNSPLIIKWYETFKAILDEYNETTLDTAPIYSVTVIQLVDLPHYLLIHVTYQYLLQHDDEFARLHAEDSQLATAEDTGYHVVSQFEWDDRRVQIFASLLLSVYKFKDIQITDIPEYHQEMWDLFHKQNFSKFHAGLRPLHSESHSKSFDINPNFFIFTFLLVIIGVKFSIYYIYKKDEQGVFSPNNFK